MQSDVGSVEGISAGLVGGLRARQVELVDVARVLRSQAVVLDRLLAAVEHGKEPARVERSPERRLLGLVRLLLDGERVRDVELGYELDSEHVAVIARGVGAREVLCAVAEGLGRQLLCVPGDEEAVWAWLGGQHRLEMTDLERALLQHDRAGSLQGVGVWFVVGEPAWGVEGWRLSHQQAQAAFVVALRRPRAFTRYGDVALLASALKDELLAGTLVEVYLAPLDRQRDRGAVSRQTLRAYFAAARNTTSAAAGLGVARRTVENRLRAIETLLGRPLHRCSAELEVALHLHDMVPAPIRRVPFSAADSRMR